MDADVTNSGPTSTPAVGPTPIAAGALAISAIAFLALIRRLFRGAVV